MFQLGELVNRNCTGTKGKERLDLVKLGVVKDYVTRLFPCAKPLEDAQWRKCVVCIGGKKGCERQGGLNGR